MRTDTSMQPGRMHMEPKRPYIFDDDHTSTMILKKQAMEQGIELRHPINYRPQHRRSARGIVAGVALGLGVWLLLAGIAVMAWRML